MITLPNHPNAKTMIAEFGDASKRNVLQNQIIFTGSPTSLSLFPDREMDLSSMNSKFMKILTNRLSNFKGEPMSELKCIQCDSDRVVARQLKGFNSTSSTILSRTR